MSTLLTVCHVNTSPKTMLLASLKSGRWLHNEGTQPTLLKETQTATKLTSSMTTGTTQTQDTSLYTSPQEGKTPEALKTPSLAISQGHVLCVMLIHVSLEVSLLSGPVGTVDTCKGFFSSMCSQVVHKIG